MYQGQNKRYIEAAMDWLCHVQDVSKDRPKKKEEK